MLARMTGGLAAAIFLVAGCSEQVMPKGTGASGTIKAASKPDLGLELINKLDADQQRRFDWLHQPFEKVVIPLAAPDTAGGKLLQAVKQRWNDFSFADVVNDKRFFYRMTIKTSAGSLEYQMSVDYHPNLSRNFLILQDLDFWKDKELRLAESYALIGDISSQEPYAVKAHSYEGIPAAGSLFVIPMGNGSFPGTQLALCLADAPVEMKVGSVFAGAISGDAKKVCTEINQQLKEKPGSVRIEKVTLDKATFKLFEADDSLALPRLGPDGIPRMRPQER